MSIYLLLVQIFSLAVSVGIGPSGVTSNKYKISVGFRGAITIKTLSKTQGVDFQFDIFFLTPTGKYFEFYRHTERQERPGNVSVRASSVSFLYTKKLEPIPKRGWHSEFSAGGMLLFYDMTATEMSATPTELWGGGPKFEFRRVKKERRGGAYGFYISLGLPFVKFETIYPRLDEHSEWTRFEKAGRGRLMPCISAGIMLSIQD